MIQLYNSDCIDILKTIPDKSIDLILTDPPYEHRNGGLGRSDLARRTTKLRNNIQFMSNSFDMESVFTEFIRICKIPNMLIFCSNMQISSIMSYFENHGYIATLLCWVKTNPIPTMNGKYLSDIEYCIYVHSKGATFNTEDTPYDYKRKAFISGLVSADRFHPAHKPDELIKRYLLLHSNENDVVLDPFMGSGTTGYWCKKLDRSFIGCEIDKKYFNICEQRINGAHKKAGLF